MASKEEYGQFLGVIRKQTGLEMLVPDADGLVTVRVQDEYNVGLQFVEETGKILCFVEMATLPPEKTETSFVKPPLICTVPPETSSLLTTELS